MSAAEYKRSAGVKAPTEEQECTWLFQWAQMHRWSGIKISDVLIHVPNGAYLGADAKTRAITMGKLKAIGVQPGCFDYLVPVPRLRGGVVIPGLWLEMKRTQGGRLETDQRTFRDRMLGFGWRCEVAKGWVEGSKVIEAYLRGTIR